MKKNSKNIYIIICLILSIGLTSNSITIFGDAMPYYITAYCTLFLFESILFISNKYLQFYDTSLYVILILAITLSNCLNQTFNYRFILFISTIVLTSPIVVNKDIFVFKAILIKYLYHIFVVITIICFVCYIIGYNGPILKNVDYNPLDFKGITNHPMWLAPISGISTICCLFYYLYAKSSKIKISNLILFFISIFTSIAAASRSSLLAVTVSIIYLIYLKSNNLKTFFTTIILGSILLLVSISNNMVDTRRIQSKNQYQKESKTNSREALWEKRYKEISDSPLWGIGFGAQGVGYEKKIGRMESGGGWIALLSQIGIIGLTIVILIIKNGIWNFKAQRHYKGVLLNTCIFIYLCVHSFFEGYINTPGYNLCILFWLIIGFLNEAKIHFNYKIDEKRSIYKRNNPYFQR